MAKFIDETASTSDEISRKNENRKTLISIIVSFALLCSFFLGFFSHYLTQSNTKLKLNEIIEILEHNTESDNKLSDDEMAKLLVSTFCKDDKYAVYYTKEEYSEEIKQSIYGKFNGFGFSIAYTDSGASIYKVLGNSPAEYAGFLSGDVIISCTKDETVVFSTLLSQKIAEDPSVTLSAIISEYFDNVPLGDEIVVTVERNGNSQDITVQKREYTLSFVNYYDNQRKMFFYSEDAGALSIREDEEKAMSNLPDDTAYISLSNFEGGAATQFADAMTYMRGKGKTKLILDLRDNGGGYMDVLQKISSYLIYNNGNKQSIISYVQQNSGHTTHYLTSGNNFNTDITDIVVLANANTASASECLIGAMLYYGGASKNNGKEIFSKKNLVLTFNSNHQNYSTYGKGIMQTTYDLKSGGAFKLTTAKILQPDLATCIHETGIVQDVEPLNNVTNENAIPRAIQILSTTPQKV